VTAADRWVGGQGTYRLTVQYIQCDTVAVYQICTVCVCQLLCFVCAHFESLYANFDFAEVGCVRSGVCGGGAAARGGIAEERRALSFSQKEKRKRGRGAGEPREELRGGGEAAAAGQRGLLWVRWMNRICVMPHWGLGALCLQCCWPHIVRSKKGPLTLELLFIRLKQSLSQHEYWQTVSTGPITVQYSTVCAQCTVWSGA